MAETNKAADRGENAIKAEHRGVTYRSQTEARWAVFFDTIGVELQYEPETITLSSGAKYMPDFYIKDFDAYFEVKPSDEKIVSEESVKARCLANDKPGTRVWLSIGGPAPKTANVLVLEKWKRDVPRRDLGKSRQSILVS